MKSINATLLANQKIPNGRGYATATLADNGRLHPTQTVTDTYTGGKTIGVECSTFYSRIRYKAGGSGTLEYQKITDPTVSSQWTTWSSLVATNVFSDKGVALFWTGSHVIASWIDTPSGDVKYKRSSDGLAWSATGVVRAALVADATAAGISGGGSTSGIMQGYNSNLYWLAYNDVTDVWSAPENSGAVFSTVAPQIAAFRDTFNARYVVAVAVQGWASYISSAAIIAYTRATGSATWSTGQPIFGGQGNTGNFQGLEFSQRQINGYWWLSFYKFRLWNVTGISNYFVAASNDGLFFDDPCPTQIAGNELALCILPAPSGGTWANAYFSTERAVCRLDTYTYFSGARVLAHQMLSARAGYQLGGGPNGKGGISPTVPSQAGQLVALIDNRDGALTTPRIFSVLTITRGLVVAGVSYGQSAGTWYVTAYRWLASDKILEITATDATGLLSTWFADSAFTHRNQTVKFLVERVCALAGVHTVTFDAFAAWTDTITAFTHAVAENAVTSLKSLADRVPFEYVAQEDGSLYFYVPGASPATQYTFDITGSNHLAWLAGPPVAGSGQNLINPLDVPPWFGAVESVTYLVDFGSPARNRAGEAVDNSLIDTVGRRRTLILNDRRLTNDADTTEAANALIIAAKERKRAGLFETPPSFALEPGDVVAIAGGSAYATANGPWRVEQIEEHFNRGGPRPFYQRVTVRGTA